MNHLCRPLLDFLLLILFLPSLLTLLTVLSQRVRILRQQKRDRAPAEAVARLPIFLWGDTEKAGPTPAAPNAAPDRPQDEESTIGSSEQPAAAGATESTPLLRPVSPQPRTVLERARIAFPRLGARRASDGLSRLEAKLAKPMRHRPRFHTTECAICLSEFEKGERVAELPCGHVFHAEEICDWLLESRRLVSRAFGSDLVEHGAGDIRPLYWPGGGLCSSHVRLETDCPLLVPLRSALFAGCRSPTSPSRLHPLRLPARSPPA